jgi:hypothetical protein
MMVMADPVSFGVSFEVPLHVTLMKIAMNADLLDDFEASQKLSPSSNPSPSPTLVNVLPFW